MSFSPTTILLPPHLLRSRGPRTLASNLWVMFSILHQSLRSRQSAELSFLGSPDLQFSQASESGPV
jgi:hypothetical protein